MLHSRPARREFPAAQRNRGFDEPVSAPGPGRFFLYLHLIDPHTPHEPDRDAVQRLIRVKRGPEGFEYDELRAVRFVPLVEGLGKDS